MNGSGSPWRTHTFAILTIAGLSASTIEFGALGAADANHAFSFAGRITGVIFICAALLTLAAIFAIFNYSGDSQRPTYAATIIAAGVTISGLMNASLAFLQIQGGDYTPFLWLWAAFTCWSSWTLWKLHRRRLMKRIPHPKKFAAGLALTSILAVANFTYSQIYKPYTEPVIVKVKTSLGTPTSSIDRKFLAVPVRIETENTGRVGVYIVGSLYQITGRKAHATNPRTMKDWEQDIDKSARDLRRNVVIDGYDLLQSGPFIDRGSFLEPGESSTESKVLQVPADSPYDALFARSQVVTIRKDRASLSSTYFKSHKYSWGKNFQHIMDAPNWVATPKSEFVEYQASITQGSTILDAIRGAKELTVWWVLDRPTQKAEFGPYLTATIASPNKEGHEPSPSDISKQFDRYGLAFFDSGAVQKSFWEMKRQ